MKAEDVIDALIARFHPAPRYAHPEWITVREFRLGCGFVTSMRRIDLWAISASPSKGNPSIAYEVKVSRSDFLRDIKAPEKHQHARLFSDRFYFAAPAGLIKAEEVPDWAGLIEVSEPIEPEGDSRFGQYLVGGTKVGDVWRKIVIVREAPLLTKHAPSWPIVVSLLRRVPALDSEAEAALSPKRCTRRTTFGKWTSSALRLIRVARNAERA